MSIKQLQLRGISRTPSEEVWVDIPGYNGKYSVSDMGRVRSNIAFNGRGKILDAPLRKKNGYRRVSIYDNNNDRKTVNVHRLVVLSFIGEIPDGMQINHINGVKTDNRAENLEIVTPSENMKHAFRLGLEKPTDNGLKKHIKVIYQGKEVRAFSSIRELCREMALDRRNVHRTISGEWKQYKGYTFSL